MYKLLIADDEYWVRKRLLTTIPWDHYGISTVKVAQNGQEALNLALELEPDIMITDINMPILTGLELMQALNESGLFPKTVLISGYNEFKYAQKAVKLGAKDYILKPVDETNLIQKIQECVAEVEHEQIQKNLFSFIEKTMPKLQTQLMYALLHNRLTSPEDFIQELASCGIQLPYTSGICFAARFSAPSATAEYSTCETLVMQTARQIMERSFDCFYLLPTPPFLTGILFCPENADGVNQALYYVCEEIMEQTLAAGKCEISIGVGSFAPGLDQFSHSYNQALQAAGKCEQLGWNDIYTISESGEKTHPLIQQAEHYIRKHYSQKITLSNISSYFYMNPSYFSKLFKQETGQTFTQYLANVRINEAKKLFKNPSFKVYDVAFAVGYQNEQYFSTLFKEICGISPTQFKNSLCG